MIEYEIEYVFVSYFSVLAFSESQALDIVNDLFGNSEIFVGATLFSVQKV